MPSAARGEGEEGKGTRTDLAVVLVFLLGFRHGGRFGACAVSRATRSEAPFGSDWEWICAFFGRGERRVTDRHFRPSKCHVLTLA